MTSDAPKKSGSDEPKFCPYLISHTNVFPDCLGSACMMFRTHKVERMIPGPNGEVTVKTEKVKYCGLAGVP